MEMEEYAEYFERTWVGDSALYPPVTWNQFDTVQLGIPRTTNHAESWHNSFARHLGHCKPTLWNFIDSVRDEQSLTEAKISRFEMREPADKGKN